MSPLVPCPSCVRHVRSNETSCPFCKNALPSGLAARAVPAAPRRLERLAAFTFAASLAMTACGGKSVDPITGSGSEEVIGDRSKDGQDGKKGEDARNGDPDEDEVPAPAPMYGMPAPPAEDAGSAMPMYGMPAPAEDAGSAMPMYGMPAPTRDAGGSAAMYGMPPGG